MKILQSKFNKAFTKWLLADRPGAEIPLCDFERLQFEVKPCDIILVEGTSRAAEIIKYVTESPWSHAALYIGKLHDIEDVNLRNIVMQHFNGDENAQLVIESYLGSGTIVSPLSSYKNDHLRICRPAGITHKDSQKVIAYMIDALGISYNTRHMFDLLRFLLPWRILPRRWGSSLFNPYIRNKRDSEICSSLLAHAFSSVYFPILPHIEIDKENKMSFRTRNPKLNVPKDFDYSPYFQIIKYPIINSLNQPDYRNLPWDDKSEHEKNIADPKNAMD